MHNNSVTDNVLYRSSASALGIYDSTRGFLCTYVSGHFGDLGDLGHDYKMQSLSPKSHIPIR